METPKEALAAPQERFLVEMRYELNQSWAEGYQREGGVRYSRQRIWKGPISGL